MKARVSGCVSFADLSLEFYGSRKMRGRACSWIIKENETEWGSRQCVNVQLFSEIKFYSPVCCAVNFSLVQVGLYFVSRKLYATSTTLWPIVIRYPFNLCPEYEL